MKDWKKTGRFLALAISACLAVIVITFLSVSSSIKLDSQFINIPIKLSDYDLNDLGVADVNQDQNLDIFTTNHSAQQSLLINDGSGQFTDVLPIWGLSQDSQFPKLENSDQQPAFNTPGLYIYRQNNLLHIVANKSESLGRVNGSLKLSSSVKFKREDLVEIDLKEESLASGGTVSDIHFSLAPGGHLAIEAFVEIPHKIQLDKKVPLQAVYLGVNALNPKSHTFELMWRDRHSMAWVDFNADDQFDVFMGRGGIKGRMHELPERFYDELFVNQGNEKFTDKIQMVGMVKANCPGRQAAWVDYDRDGLLDLYHACGRGSSDPAAYPHQLFHQEPDGNFTNVAKEVALDLPGSGEFIWLDADQDDDLDVIATQNKKLSAHYNQDNTFVSKFLGDLADDSTKKFTVVDYDLDSSLDIYIAGNTQNYLLTKDGDHYTLKGPQEVGLPNQGLCANWVDYDNDGLSDLYVVPGGLYRQLPEHKFEPTQLISENTEIIGGKSSRLLGWNKTKLRDVRCSWFDYDNDGFRDLLLSEERVPSFRERMLSKLMRHDSKIRWKTNLFRNKGFGSHWLEIELQGLDHNKQAIGAVVTLQNADVKQMQQVGSSEGSYFSQGHYRLYFGLGTEKRVDSIAVRWPNGTIQTLKDVSGDQLITIHQAST